MQFIPCGSVPTLPAPKDYFTGRVLMQRFLAAPPPARLSSLLVSFEPRARTFWHKHPFGQTLYIVQGAGRVQCWGEPVREVRAGDVVYFEPGEKHWHGGGLTTAMSHVAMQEQQDGVTADWLEEVADEHFEGPAGA